MRNWLLAGVVALVLLGIVAYAHWSSTRVSPMDTTTPPVDTVTAPATPAVNADLKPAIAPPSFDIVRVEPTGEVVVGGRGEPGSAMTLLDSGKSFETAKVGESGQFAMVPPPLKPGPHNLTLAMKLADGHVLNSTQNVAVDVPENKTSPLLVAKTESGKPTQLLTPVITELPATPSEPSQPSKIAELETGRAVVAITVVEAEDSGTLYAAGKAAPGASVRLYLNDTYLAQADVGPDSAWSLKIAKGVVPGQYKVRADDVSAATGKVLSRAEVNFDFVLKTGDAAQSAPSAAASTPNSASQTGKSVGAVVIDSIETATVIRGDSLWRISRKTYGSGYRYTEIHRANQEQIRDPDLIYPGQIFVLPKLNP